MSDLIHAQEGRADGRRQRHPVEGGFLSNGVSTASPSDIESQMIKLDERRRRYLLHRFWRKDKKWPPPSLNGNAAAAAAAQQNAFKSQMKQADCETLFVFCARTAVYLWSVGRFNRHAERLNNCGSFCCCCSDSL